MDDSPFGKISPELRNRIYELALFERRPASISKSFWTEPALLRTCKQVREEAELMFYAVNDFTFVTFVREEDNKRLAHWLKYGPKQELALIKSLTIRVELPGLKKNPAGFRSSAPRKVSNQSFVSFNIALLANDR